MASILPFPQWTQWKQCRKQAQSCLAPNNISLDKIPSLVVCRDINRTLIKPTAVVDSHITLCSSLSSLPKINRDFLAESRAPCTVLNMIFLCKLNWGFIKTSETNTLSKAMQSTPLTDLNRTKDLSRRHRMVSHLSANLHLGHQYYRMG